MIKFYYIIIYFYKLLSTSQILGNLYNKTYNPAKDATYKGQYHLLKIQLVKVKVILFFFVLFQQRRTAIACNSEDKLLNENKTLFAFSSLSALLCSIGTKNNNTIFIFNTWIFSYKILLISLYSLVILSVLLYVFSFKTYIFYTIFNPDNIIKAI